MPASNAPPRYRPETHLVHAGQIRSELGETSETLFLTQGFVYETAEECAARFKGEEPGFVYARFPIRRSRCSSSAWRRSRAPKPRARPRAAWRR